MKSYTDLEQSRKLAEILPLESADMFIADVFNKEQQTHSYNFHILSAWGHKNFDELKERENKFVQFIPCWSLAALLDVLPNNKHISTSVSRGGWQIEPINYLPNIWWCEYEDSENLTEFNVSADNSVDAAFEMILKLKEQNLI